MTALLPPDGALPTDAALDHFLSWVQGRSLQLWPHQEEAVLEIYSGRHVVLDAPTGSGKSLVAQALHWKTRCEGGRTVYTAPVKALVHEKFLDLCHHFGAEHVGMMTGDGAVNRDAPILCCTAEILARMALSRQNRESIRSAVLDEFHYYGDRDRGTAWQIPLLRLPQCQFLLLSGTLGDTAALREDLHQRTGREAALVRGVHRPVPLRFHWSKKPLLEQLTDLVHGGKAPVYVVFFTQNAATDQAQDLMSTDWCTKDEKKRIAEALRGVRFSSPFGPTLERYLRHGVGVHHAGLLPRYRLAVERLSQQGLLKVICGTDTLGVGINVPIRTVLFSQLCKFDGEKVDVLDGRSFHQIAGRAGRAGFDTEGHVVVQAPEHIIENLRAETKAQGDAKKLKKLVKAQPPTKGYKHWDESTFQQLVERPPAPLQSRFRIDHGLLVALLQDAADHNGGQARAGFEDLLALIEDSHASAPEKVALRKRAAELLDALERAGVVVQEGWDLRLVPGLQRSFGLHHNLSLLLVDALATLDPSAPTHWHSVLAWVEAILDNPTAILIKQQDRARTELLYQLKAEGVPYEERQDKLDAVTWPKPEEQAIYAFFDAWREHHPWLENDNVRPKGVVRAMIDEYASVHQWVKDLALQRQEGLLLRYLTDAYKALVQNVPDERRTDELAEWTAWLRATIEVVDGSLLAEWERLLRGEDVAEEKAAPIDISADKKSFYARLRAETHQILSALSRADWEELIAALRPDPEGALPEGADLDALIRPDVEPLGGVRFDHESRKAEHWRIDVVGPWRWEIRQVVLPPRPPGHADGLESDEEREERGEGEMRFLMRLGCDLRGDTNPHGPLLYWIGWE